MKDFETFLRDNNFTLKSLTIGSTPVICGQEFESIIVFDDKKRECAMMMKNSTVSAMDVLGALTDPTRSIGYALSFHNSPMNSFDLIIADGNVIRSRFDVPFTDEIISSFSMLLGNELPVRNEGEIAIGDIVYIKNDEDARQYRVMGIEIKKRMTPNFSDVVTETVYGIQSVLIVECDSMTCGHCYREDLKREDICTADEFKKNCVENLKRDIAVLRKVMEIPETEAQVVLDGCDEELRKLNLLK